MSRCTPGLACWGVPTPASIPAFVRDLKMVMRARAFASAYYCILGGVAGPRGGVLLGTLGSRSLRGRYRVPRQTSTACFNRLFDHLAPLWHVFLRLHFLLPTNFICCFHLSASTWVALLRRI